MTPNKTIKEGRRRMAKTIGYFPTVDEAPGRMDTEQICYADSHCFPVKLEKDRATVRRQINKSVAFRKRNGWAEEYERSRYGIVRVAA
jgi:hypothetical protein